MNRERANELLAIADTYIAGAPDKAIRNKEGILCQIRLENSLYEAFNTILKEDSKLTFPPLDILRVAEQAFFSYYRQRPGATQNDLYIEPEKFLQTYLAQVTNARMKSPQGFKDVNILTPEYDRDGLLVGIKLNYSVLREVAEGRIILGADMSKEERKAFIKDVYAQPNKDGIKITG